MGAALTHSCFVVGLSRILFIFCFLVVHFVVFGFSEKHISPQRGVMLSESGMHAFQLGELCFPSRGCMLSNVGSYAFRVGDACFPRETLLPSRGDWGDWGLQSSHRRGCGPTKGSESLIRDGGL